MFGKPVELEKRTVTGVDDRRACGARVNVAASDDGVNIPAHIIPFACAGRKPECSPKSASKASRSSCATAGLSTIPVGLRAALLSLEETVLIICLTISLYFEW